MGFEHAVCFATGFTMQNLRHIVTIEFSANKKNTNATLLAISCASIRFCTLQLTSNYPIAW